MGMGERKRVRLREITFGQLVLFIKKWHMREKTDVTDLRWRGCLLGKREWEKGRGETGLWGQE